MEKLNSISESLYSESPIVKNKREAHELGVCEGRLREAILSDLEKSRKNFDRPHTEGVVNYVKKILDNSPDLDEKLDRTVIVIAAYAHDWGYIEGGSDFSAMYKAGKQAQIKEQHAIFSRDKLKNLLDESEFDFLTDERKERALLLTLTHDNVEDLTDEDQKVLMEADTLGAIDVDVVAPTFDPEANAKYLRTSLIKRTSRFISSYSKQVLSETLKKRQEYYDAMYERWDWEI